MINQSSSGVVESFHMKSKILNTNLPLILLFFIILFTIFFRVRLLDVPLERDEGEYAYMGQLILDGTPPYTEAYNMKFPGIYFIYAGILWLFGETHTAIHFCLLIVNVLSIILLYIFARKAYDDWIAAASACAFALLSMSYHVQGFWANAEHFILPFVIGANIFLLSGLKKSRVNNILYSGILFGCAALVKQHGAFFGLFGFGALLFLLWQNKTVDKKIYWKHILAFFGGVIIPLLLCFFYLVYAGVLEKFYLWTFVYAKEYSSIQSLDGIKFSFIGGFQSIWHFASLIWIIAGVGFITLFSKKYNKQPGILIIGLFIAGCVALSVGFYFRPHYFVLVLPAAALLFGIGIRYIFHIFSAASLPIVRYFPPIFTVTITILGTIVAHWDVLYQFSPAEVTQIVYPLYPFPYSPRIAEIIRERTLKGDRIAIIGNEPQLLFYSRHRSATSFIYTYSIGEDQPLSEQFRFEMIRQVESTSPKLLIYTNVQPEWYKKPKGWEELDKWFFSFTKLHYIPFTRFEYENIKDTLLITDQALLLKKPTHLFWITMYEKNK
jgi:4-amino-4-deoxy-L-arabinose transferase-like glycosyltransferase